MECLCVTGKCVTGIVSAGPWVSPSRLGLPEPAALIDA